jgi:hypothetical protein
MIKRNHIFSPQGLLAFTALLFQCEKFACAALVSGCSEPKTPAASPARRVRVQPGKSLARPRDNQCAITANPGLARLGIQPLLNHARQHRWPAQPPASCAYSILTSTNKAATETSRTGNGYPRPLPQGTRPGPPDRV